VGITASGEGGGEQEREFGNIELRHVKASAISPASFSHQGSRMARPCAPKVRSLLLAAPFSPQTLKTISQDAGWYSECQKIIPQCNREIPPPHLTASAPI
jgi:hypothetical protein